MTGIWYWARHEWGAIRRDRGASAVLIAAAVLYALVYPIPFLYQVARDIGIVVVDLDRSAMSRQVTRMIDAAEQVRVHEIVGSEREAEERVRAGIVHGAVVIPSEFERHVQRGERVIVGVYGDASYFSVYSQIATGASAAIGTFSAGVELRRLQASGFDAASARQAREPLPLTVRTLYNPVGGYGNSNVPAVLILVLQQTMLIGIGTLAGGRRERSTEMLPRDDGLVRLLGRALVYVGIYLVHVVLTYFIAYRLYGLPHTESLPVLMLFLLPFLVATAMLGLALSRLFLTAESALQALMFSSLPAIFISGFSFPAEAMPSWIRALAQLLPSTQAIAGAQRVVQMGASFADVRTPWLTLWGLSAAYLVAAWGLTVRDRRSAARIRDRVGGNASDQPDDGRAELPLEGLPS